jgi:hypothetical protein
VATVYRIRPILRRRAAIEDAAVRAQLRILRAARRDILAAMVDAGAFDRWRLQQLLGAIDRVIAQARGFGETAAAASTEQAFALGASVLPGSLVGMSRELAQAIVTVTTDQVRDVWGELGSNLKRLVRRAALGVTDPFKAMQQLARLIRDPKTFGRAFWRAESIIRTEVGRAFSIASQDSLEQAAARGGKSGITIRKYWLTAHDERVRETHRQAGIDYAIGKAIAADAFFVVGGERLKEPLDPNGSAGETINCRCVSVPVVILD